VKIRGPLGTSSDITSKSGFFASLNIMGSLKGFCEVEPEGFERKTFRK
jgi:hypothetical protein